MRHRDGTVFHVFDRGQVVERDEAGNPTRMAGAVSDITERVHAEHRLRITTEALIDANISLERKVEERTAELERANENLRNLAWRDALTGLPNRLSGMDRLAAEFARLTRGDAASSVLMIDVDLFKPINDTYGHGVGDDVLRHIASLIKTSLRTGDFVARFGGEEFMALLPDTDLEGARIVAEKIREAIQDNPQSTVGAVTISVGVALASGSDPEMDAAVRRADAALYEAKRSGRNLVVVAPQPDFLTGHAPGDHSGRLFSMKAVIPSRASSDEKSSDDIRAATPNPSATSTSGIRRSSSLVRARACGPPAVSAST